MLPQHQIYRKLDAPVTVLGIDLEDWFGVGVAFIMMSLTRDIMMSRVSDLAVGRILGWPRAEAGVSVLATGAIFLLWRRVRERTPRHFIRHLLGYLSEPEAYTVTPDRDVNPYVL